MASVMRRAVAAGVMWAVLGISGTAAASDESGLYLVASYGRAPKFFPRSGLDAALLEIYDDTLTLDSSSVERDDKVWSAGVGYRLSPHFALEATYLDLGKLHYHAAGTSTIQGPSKTTDVTLDTKSHGPTLALIWALPLWNEWGVDARAGVYRGTTSTQLVNTLGDTPHPLDVAAKSTSLLLGIGGSFVATEHLIVRLDYLHLNKITEQAFERKFDADVVTAGLTYQF